MSINVVSNPKKLRKLSNRLGSPVIRAYARWFTNQRTLLAFTNETTAWIMRANGEIELYTDRPLRLEDGGIRILGEL